MIKILFLAANPVDTDPLELEEEARAIDDALRRAQYRENIELVTHWAVQIDDLQSLLLRHRPHIVHFSGHGSSTNEIILRDYDGYSTIAPPMALSMLFKVLHDNIRCVLLNACFSASQGAAIAQHIDCVIGMPDVISDRASRQYAASFYQGLAYGRSVGEAYELGNIQLALHGLAEEHTPRLLGLPDPKSIYFVNPNTIEKKELLESPVQFDLNTLSVYREKRSLLPSVNTPRLGRLPSPLTEQEITRFIEKYPEWNLFDTEDTNAKEGVRRELYRVFEFPSYKSAFRFITDVSEQAIAPLNHHPRWQNTWNRVEIWLTTFNLGYRPSTKDRRFAEKAEQIWKFARSTFDD